MIYQFINLSNRYLRSFHVQDKVLGIMGKTGSIVYLAPALKDFTAAGTGK